MRNKISLYSIIGGILLLLVNNGWIKIDVDPKPPVVDNTPVVVDPVVTPPVVTPPVVNPPVVVPPVVEPDVVVPTPVVDNDVVNTYPEVPKNLMEVSQPIYELLVKCKNRGNALTLANTYRTWSGTEVNLAEAIGKTSYFVQFNNGILKDMMKDNNIPRDFCPGMADAIEAVMDYAVGETEGKFVSTDDARIKDAFKAISAQAYRAYLEHKGG